LGISRRRAETTRGKRETIEMNLPSFVHEQSDGVVLSIKLQPRAATNEIIGVAGSELRVKVTAPPVDAAANEALVRLLADKLDCHRNQVALVRGHTSRHKVVKILGMKGEVVVSRLHGREPR
jgi:uncharacterized protein (TIGR00251 family)